MSGQRFLNIKAVAVSIGLSFWFNTAPAQISFQFHFVTPEPGLLVDNQWQLPPSFTNAVLNEPGHPALPYKIIHLPLPPGQQIESLSATIGDTQTLDGQFDIPTGFLPVRPDDHSVWEGHSLPDPSVYQQDNLFPGEIVQLLSQGVLDQTPTAAIALYPVQYYPLSKQIFIITRLNLTLFTRPSSWVQVPRLTANDIDSKGFFSPDLEETSPLPCHRRGSTGTYVAGTSVTAGAFGRPLGATYVLVTHTKLAPYFEPLVRWKNQKGLKSAIALIDSIGLYYSGRDPAEKLRNYLIDCYIHGARWVLLAGDEDLLPIRYAYYANTATQPPLTDLQICDLYFSDVNGLWDVDNDGIWGEPNDDQPDIYPDLFVGRLPTHDTTEVKNFVNKLLTYEKHPGQGDFSYLFRVTHISSDQMRDYPANLGQHGLVAQKIPAYFQQDLTNLVETPSGAAPDPPSPEGPSCITFLSRGSGLVTIFAHGRDEAFIAKSNLVAQSPKSYVFTWGSNGDGHGHLSSLSNTDRYGIWYSISCDHTHIDNDKPPMNATARTVGEAAVVAKDVGAIAFIGHSRWGWVYSSYMLVQKFMEKLFSQDPSTQHLGVAMAWAKASFPTYRDLNYNQLLFGDPEMPVWTDTPRPIQIAAPSYLPAGSQVLNVNISSENLPLANTTVAIVTEPDSIIAVGNTDQSGRATFSLLIPDSGSYTVTATKPNFLPGATKIYLGATLSVNSENQSSVTFALKQNQPNPFNASTRIYFDLPYSGKTALVIFNLLGEKVATLVDQTLTSGNHSLVWNGKNQDGVEVASGIYFYRLATPSETSVKKMLLLR